MTNPFLPPPNAVDAANVPQSATSKKLRQLRLKSPSAKTGNAENLASSVTLVHHKQRLHCRHPSSN
jgi:hypothetical protein